MNYGTIPSEGDIEGACEKSPVIVGKQANPSTTSWISFKTIGLLLIPLFFFVAVTTTYYKSYNPQLKISTLQANKVPISLLSTNATGDDFGTTDPSCFMCFRVLSQYWIKPPPVGIIYDFNQSCRLRFPNSLAQV
jgi:hypothetical protein